MPTAPRTLLFNNGLVDAKDASMIQSGELDRATDAFYKPNSPTAFKVSGRTQFNSSAESDPIRGGRFLDFDNGTSLFVVMTGTTYRVATAGTTGTFSNLVTGLSGTATTFDAVHYNDQWVLLNGVDRGQVVSDDQSVVLLGMLINITPPDVNTGNGATAYTLSLGSTMTYWIEEIVKDADGVVVKRNASDTTTVTTITGLGVAINPQVTLPPLVNSDTTDWALYSTATNGTFPNGNQIGEVPIATTTIDDTRTGTDPSIPSGSAYETTSVTLFGLATITPQNGPPPTSRTGAILENALLLNSETEKSRVWFSVTDNIHAFPVVNAFRFEEKERDEVRGIVALDNIAIVLNRDGVFRINTLPTPNDAAFSTERFKARVHGAQGIVNSIAYTVFSFGEGIRVAYVSPYGVLVTDGQRWSVISDDMDWETRVDIANVSSARLVNDPRFFRIVLLAQPPGASRPTEQWFLHYHQSHGKLSTAGGLRAKITGPINRDANDIFKAKISDIDEIFSCNEDGRVYRDNQGNSEPTAIGGIQFEVRTGDYFLAGVGRDTTVAEVFLHHQAHANQVITATLNQRNNGEVDEEIQQQIDADFREATRTALTGAGEAFQFGARNSDTLGTIGIDFATAIVGVGSRSTEG